MLGSEEFAQSAGNQRRGSKRILVLFVLGFLIILLGIIIFAVATALSGGGSANFGIVIFIGPIPIVLGAGPQVTWLVLSAIILAALSIIIFLLMRRKTEKTNA